MHVLILNGSPRRQGNVASLLRAMAESLPSGAESQWINVYDLAMQPCRACMRCRSTGVCCLSEDDAHQVGQWIAAADGLVVGTPTHWGNMSSQLKLLFDRNVPVFIRERTNGIPQPMQKGKPAAIVAACTTPRLLDLVAGQSRGAIRTVGEILHYAGYRIVGRVARCGTKSRSAIPDRLLAKARRIGGRFR